MLFKQSSRKIILLFLLLWFETCEPPLDLSIVQVLEDVCHKQKFLPPEDYKLVHGRKTLDVTLAVRYANLSNNAKLELVKSEKAREESEVLIALQLEGGERLQHSFSPGVTLWDILLYWENVPDSPHSGVLTRIDSSQVPSIQPVCIYMREEVIGEESLKETQLRSLGLTGGKAVIRLIHRPVEDEVLAQISGQLEKERLKKATQQAAAAQHQTSASQSTISSSEQQSVSESKLPTSVQSQSQPLNAEQLAQKQPNSEKSQEPSAKKGKPEPGSHDSAEPMETESGDQVPERGQPMEAEVTNGTAANGQVAQTENTENSTRQEQREAAARLRSLNIPGVEIYTPDDFADLTPEQQQVARQLAQAYLPQLGISQAATNQTANAKSKKSAVPKKYVAPQALFADFKSKISGERSQDQWSSGFQFPEETKGKNLYSNEISDVKKEDFKPCDRQTVLFNIEEHREQTSDESEELPDEFFKHTERDLRVLMMDQKKKMESMEDQPLMTQSLRRARLEEEYSQYDRVIIRIQFPDKLVLQGLFRPRETVFSLQKFVKEYLEDKSCPFYLYTSPPKQVLSDQSQTLIEAKLVPATVVYFGSEQCKDHYLSNAVLCEITTKLAADQVVYECLSSSNVTTSQSSQQSSSSGSGKGKQPKSSAKGNQTSSDGKPVPKWFKASKK